MQKSPYLCTIKSKQLENYGKDRIRNLGLGRRSIWRRRSIRQQDRRRELEARIRRGYEERTKPLGHGYRVWHGRVGEDSWLVCTKFTPQLAEVYENSVEKMALASIDRMGIDYIDMYWIHNPMDVERWTPGLIPLLQSGKVKRVGVSNHNIAEIRRANEILGEAGFKVSAVQNHFSLLYRSSEKGGVLDYCKENGIEFWAYMVLEQGALSGKYNKENPLPAESNRGKKYNPVLEQLEALTNEMTTIGKKYGASCSQIGIAWAIAKGTQPIIGATKERHVIEAAEAAKIQLTSEEVARLEALADATGIDTRGGWEHSME